MVRKNRSILKALSIGLLTLIVLAAIYLAWRFTQDSTTHYESDVEHFKYGSTGGERVAGIPLAVWKAMPEMCAKYLPGDGLQSLGFVFEPGKELPIGISKRQSLGMERVWLNCAVCHTGQVRDTADGEARIVLGMPANTFDLNRFSQFVFDCALDEAFFGPRVVREAEHAGYEMDFIEKLTLSSIGVTLVRDGLLLLRHRLRFTGLEPVAGPGRFDTFSPAKAFLNWTFENLPERERVGNVDFPSIWNQQARKGMQLHWDGNNDNVEERNRSAGMATGALPTVADRASLKRTAKYLETATPPAYPYPIDQDKAAAGAPLYQQYCADCHGKSGSDFSGAQVGKVVPIEEIGTDPCRLDNYTHTLAVEQNTIYANYPDERFQNFRKTYGYANMPLDGIWLRAPYLHNGSVPTLRDLLEPSEQRPKAFYRGYDLYDREKLGFVSDVAMADGREFFLYETQCSDDPGRGIRCEDETNPDNEYPQHQCVMSKWAGNSNRGHEGERYGTELAAEQKDAIVEYLKTF